MEWVAAVATLGAGGVDPGSGAAWGPVGGDGSDPGGGDGCAFKAIFESMWVAKGRGGKWWPTGTAAHMVIGNALADVVEL